MSNNPVGRSLAKVLGIKLDYRKEEPISSGAASISSVETCELFKLERRVRTNLSRTDVEKEPTTIEYVSQFKPTKSGATRYLRSLFPFWSWIFHYNLTWLLGDIIAGEYLSPTTPEEACDRSAFVTSRRCRYCFAETTIAISTSLPYLTGEALPLARTMQTSLMGMAETRANHSQVSLSDLSSFHRAWHMRCWPSCLRNMDSILRSSGFYSTGPLLLRRISRLV